MGNQKYKDIEQKIILEIFKEFELDLTFPPNAKLGNVIIDGNLKKGLIDLEESDLQKFKKVIQSNYSNLFEFWDPKIPYGIGIKYKDVDYENKGSGYYRELQSRRELKHNSKISPKGR